MEVEHKAGFVNIIGRPNVGKSTLMNALVGERMSIITRKPQTTRHRIIGILNAESYQIVFSDTPGIVKDPAYKMHESMNNFVKGAFEDADIMLFVTDNREKYDDKTPIINKLNKLDVPKFLIINKIDTSTEDQLKEIEEEWTQVFNFDKVFKISALQKINTEELLKEIINNLEVSPPYYPKDQLTDRSERFFVSEIIREHILELYEQEIPYSAEVGIEYFKKDQPTRSGDKITKIGALIYVNRDTQKSIIIGKRGVGIKELGSRARKEIEIFVGSRVFLEIHVKVKKDWRNNKQILGQFGYQ